MIYTQGDQMRTKNTIHELEQFLLHNIKKSAFAFHSQNDCQSGNNLDFILKSCCATDKRQNFFLIHL